MARSGLPDVRDFLIGRGALYFSDNLDADGRPKEFRHLGNAAAFTVSIETEKLEHFSSLEGLKKRDRNTVVSQALGMSMQLEEIDVDNLRLFLSGANAVLAQTSTAVDADPAGDPNLIVSGKGRWYDLYDIASPSTYPPATADAATRVYDLTLVTVKLEDDVVTYVSGVDYDMDLKHGRIFIREAGAIGAAVGLNVDFTHGSQNIDIDEVRGVTTAQLVGALKFVSVNPNDGSKEIEYEFHSVLLSAEGDFSLISDEFTTLTITGEAGENTVAYPNSPTVTIRRLKDA